MTFVAIYDFSNFFVPDVIEGDAFHDLMASFMKLIAQLMNTIAMPARKIGITFFILDIGWNDDYQVSLRQEDCGLKLDVIWKYVLLILSFRILDTSIKKNERFQVCRQGVVLLLLFLLKCAIFIHTGQKGKRLWNTVYVCFSLVSLSFSHAIQNLHLLSNFQWILDKWHFRGLWYALYMSFG